MGRPKTPHRRLFIVSWVRATSSQLSRNAFLSLGSGPPLSCICTPQISCTKGSTVIMSSSCLMGRHSMSRNPSCRGLSFRDQRPRRRLLAVLIPNGTSIDDQAFRMRHRKQRILERHMRYTVLAYFYSRSRIGNLYTK